MEDFIALAKLVPEMNFDLFAIGHDWPKLSKLNHKKRQSDHCPRTAIV
jgi:hypothetical protein